MLCFTIPQDARRKLIVHDCDDPDNWLDCYITQVKRTIEATIRTEIAPEYEECLGNDPIIDVTMTRSSFEEVNQVPCANDAGEVKEFLESFSLADFHITTHGRVTCDMCNSIDFAKTGNGVVIDETYIDADTWQASHGVRVSARAAYGEGYTPGNKPRAFNANKRINFVMDMRTPNENCPGGGPGRGAGGVPGQDGENCMSVGSTFLFDY